MILSYNRIDLGLNRLVTLPLRLYKAGRDPLEFISYSIQSNKTHDQMAQTCLNRSLHLVSPSISYCTHLHRSSTTVGIPIGRLPTRWSLSQAPWPRPDLHGRIHDLDHRPRRQQGDHGSGVGSPYADHANTCNDISDPDALLLG